MSHTPELGVPGTPEFDWGMKLEETCLQTVLVLCDLMH